ncbi:MAG: PadR family transcriptional regulator [Candidatus Dormibacteria bacterium]
MLGDGPQHGYQIIRQLRDRFQGRYTPSAGSIYPRLRQLQEEGLIEAREEQDRVVYHLTERGRATVREQADEIQRMDTEIGRMAHEMAADLKSDVRESARNLRQELRDQARGLRQRESAASPYGAELRQQLERLTREWGSVIPPGIPPSQVRAALDETLAMAREHLREALRGPRRPR